MRRTKPNLSKFDWADFLKMAALGVLLLAGFSAGSAAQQKGQKTFSSPEEASKAVVAAAQNNVMKKRCSEFSDRMRRTSVSSGDPTQDAENHTNFARKYQEMQPLRKRTRRLRHAVHWRGKLARTDSSPDERQCLVLRHRSRKDGDLIPPNRP